MPQEEESHTLVPNRDYEADSLVPVADIDDAVFIQAISPRPRMIVRQLIPSGAVSTVVFAEGALGTLSQIMPMMMLHRGCSTADANDRLAIAPAIIPSEPSPDQLVHSSIPM